MSSNIEASTRYTPATMEAFEPRLMLDGNVLAEITSSGDLIITGDEMANYIDVVEAGGVITITSDDTKVNGLNAENGIALNGAFSRHIKVKMGDGDDTVNISSDADLDDNDPFEIGGNVLIDLGEGTDNDDDTMQEASLYYVDVEGSVKFTDKSNGESYAYITDSTIGKNVQLDFAGGDTNVEIYESTIKGNLKIANKGGESDEAYLDIEESSFGKNVQISLSGDYCGTTFYDANIGGNLKIQNKDGLEHEVDISMTTVNGSVSIANGNGLHEVGIEDSMIGKNLLIKNKDLVIPEGGNPASQQQITIHDTDIFGGVKISNGKGASFIDIDDIDDEDGDGNPDENGDSVTIGKNLQISTKDGNDEIYVYDTTASNIKINTGKGGRDTTSVYVEEVAARGSLTVANKSGATDIMVWNTSVGKKTTLTGGKAATTVDIVNLIATDGLQIKGGGFEVGKLIVTAINLTGGKMTIQGAGDLDEITLDDFELESLQINGGEGADWIFIETAGAALGDDGGRMSIVGTLKIDGGNGDDFVIVGEIDADARGLELKGKASLNGGKRYDTLIAGAGRGNIFDEEMLTIKNFENSDLAL